MTDMTIQDAALLVSQPRATPSTPTKVVAVVQPKTEASVRRDIKVTEFKFIAYSLIKFVLILAFLASGWDVAADYHGAPTFYMTVPMARFLLTFSTLAFIGFQIITMRLDPILESHYEDLEQFDN